MQNTTIIKQLEKALECKDDKELRLRVEILLDVLKESGGPFTTPSVPLPTYYETDNIPKPTIVAEQPKVTGKKSNQVRGAGSITSFDSEQINYRRPPNT